MSILSDRQIKELCIIPEFITEGDEFITSSRWPTEEEKSNFKPMISPYVSGQVRIKELETLEEFYTRMGDLIQALPEDHIDKGREVLRICWDGDILDNEEVKQNIEKVISYGQSSFGYDVRLADEFKIFTNVNSIIIDPLDFDQACCVDHKGPFCIIPPNSYILGRTMETFDMPRDITAVCLGKSTYARVGAIVNVTPIEAGFVGTVVIEISNSTSLPLKVYAGMGIAQFLFFKGDDECKVSYADRDGKYQGQTGIQTALV